MYRKLVFSGISALALMTLVVSAQQPAQRVNQGDAYPDPVPAEKPRPSSGGAVNQKLPSVQLGYQGQNPFQGHQGGYGGLYGYTRIGMNREEHQLTQESEELVKQLAKAEGENKEKIRTKLTETLGKQFDARQKRHEAEIAALEAQVKKLKEMVQKRQENRKDIIGKRFEQLVRETEGLGW